LEHCDAGDVMVEDVVFTARSRFRKKIRLFKAVWVGKILKDHPELKAREQYVDEVKRAIEDPDYIVSGWFASTLL